MKRKLFSRRLVACMAFCALGMSTLSGWADPAVFEQDTHTRANKPDNNYGASGALFVNDGVIRQSFVQFDTTNFGGVVIQATVSVRVSSVTSPGTIDIYPVQQSWDGNSVTFNDSPAIGSSPIASIAVTAADVGSYVSADITALVQSWVDDPLNSTGIALVPSSGVKAKLSSGESAFPPQLDITDDGTPPPPPPPPPPGPAIAVHSVFADLDAGTLAITGVNFDMGASPLVLLGDFGLLTVMGTPTSTTINANLPAGIPDGDHLLTITLGEADDQNTTFDLTLGATGPQGDAGPAGPQGVAGPVGSQGDAGPQGLQGSMGPAGAQGDAGPVGVQGDAGPPGLQGPIGLTGANGADGPQGDIGEMGLQGDAGPTGAQGDPGPTGPTGAVGSQGQQGPIGLTGPAGAQGDAGPAGAQGPMGITGGVGPIGPDGPEGMIGPMGPVGAAGPDGPEGPQGPPGAGALSSYANLTVVAVSGGDYTSPVTAMANATTGDTWCPLPSATQRCLLQIMPGVFDLGASSSSGALVMQQYIDIAGSGQRATLLQGTGFSASGTLVRVASDAQLRDLSIEVTGGNYAIGVRGNGNLGGTGERADLLNLRVQATGAQTAYGVMLQNQGAELSTMRNVTAHAEGSSTVALYNACANVDLDGGVFTAVSTQSGGTATGITDLNDVSTCSITFRGRIANVRVSAMVGANGSLATALQAGSSQSYFHNIAATAEGGTIRALGLHLHSTSTAIIDGSFFEATNASENYGAFGVGSAAVITSSTLIGSSGAARIAQSGTVSPATLQIGGSQLSGGPVTTTGTGIVTCAGVFDENFVFSASTCP